MFNLDAIDPLIIKDIENPNHPSEFIWQEEYAVLILRLPEVHSEGVEVFSYAFVFDGKELSVFDREKNQLEPMGKIASLVEFLNPKIDRLLKEVQLYHYDIEMLEESLFDENVSDVFMQEWLRYKKDLSLIHRVMFHASLAYEMYMNKIGKESLSFEDIAEHISRIRDLAKAALEKLDNLYDFYRAKVDERMNKNVYYLTLISGIFLPLTLITGFFGMNTGGLPWMDDAEGTLKAVLVAVVLEVVMVLPLFLLNSGKIKRFQRKR